MTSIPWIMMDHSDKTTFFDLEEHILDVHIEGKRYNKRVAIKFEIITYINITTKPAYGFSHPKSFVMLGSAVGKMIWSKGLSASQKLLRKHSTIHGLNSSLKKCLKKYCWITTKLGPRLHRNLTEEWWSTLYEFWPFLLITHYSCLESWNIFTYYPSKPMYNWMKWLRLLGADTSYLLQ